MIVLGSLIDCDPRTDTQLNGLSVIRAFRRRATFEKRLQDAINKECVGNHHSCGKDAADNPASLYPDCTRLPDTGEAVITDGQLTIQRWLGVRLDLFANLLVMVRWL